MKGLKKTVAMIKTLLNIKEIPIKGGKTDFSDKQKEKMTEKLGEDLSQKAIDAIEKEASAILEQEDNKTELSEVQKELREALKDTNLSEEEAMEIAKSNDKENNAEEEDISVQSVLKLTRELMAQNKNQDKLIQKLINDPEGDSPVASGDVKSKEKVQHSKTHLFASEKEYDSFEGRPWNKKAAGISSKKTNWASSSGIEIQKLNEDLDHYFRENPDAIRSLHRDNFDLPAFWPKRTKVDDEVSDGTIVSAEISQARKAPWLPKNKQAIKAEKGKIFPVQIDIEYVGNELQKYEASWISKFVGEGSSPYKISFVRFLVGELDKKARQEDRMASIKGVYVETPDDANKPGRAINRQDGLLIQLYRAYHLHKKFKVANIGRPTPQNIVDYVPKMINANLKEELKDQTNLAFYWSPDWERYYKTRYKQINGTNLDYDGDNMKIDNFPNVEFISLPDLAGTDFMFITFKDNIQILENIPEEKSLYRFEYLRRMIYVLGDYKLGIRMIHIGNKVKEGDPDAFKVQTVWTNGMPMFKNDFFIPLYDDGTGEVNLSYSNVKVDDAWDTDITDIEGTYSGQVVKIKGNQSLVNARNVVSTGNITLDSNFNLKSGGTLTLFVENDGSLKELTRTTEPEAVEPEIVKFEGDVIDSVNGSDQVYADNEANTIAEIINGVDGAQLTVTAEAGAGALTFEDVSGNIKLEGGTDALLDSEGDKISFVFVNETWLETSREIAGA